MQTELTSLRPELIKTSGETEKLMVVVEKETRQVEEQRQVSSAEITVTAIHVIAIFWTAGRS